MNGCTNRTSIPIVQYDRAGEVDDVVQIGHMTCGETDGKLPAPCEIRHVQKSGVRV